MTKKQEHENEMSLQTEVDARNAETSRREIETLKDTSIPKYVGYLDIHRKQVTTWIGEKIGTITRIRDCAHNMAGTMYYFQMTDVHGNCWHGRGIGHQMSCIITRCKARRKVA